MYIVEVLSLNKDLNGWIKIISLQTNTRQSLLLEIHFLNALDPISNFPFSMGAMYVWAPEHILIVATIMQLNK